MPFFLAFISLTTLEYILYIAETPNIVKSKGQWLDYSIALVLFGFHTEKKYFIIYKINSTQQQTTRYIG